MTTSEIIAQNPVLWLVCTVGAAVITAVSITWKVLESVRVKPKEDRIQDLSQDIDRLRQHQEHQLADCHKQLDSFKAKLEESERKRASIETERNASLVELKSVTHKPTVPPIDVAFPLLPEISVNQNMVTPHGCTPQTSLHVLYTMWSGDGITDLQKKQFEKDYIGKQVCWNVRVSSVTSSSDSITLTVLDTAEQWKCAFAWGVFPLSAEPSLLQLKKDDIIVLRGVIKEFFFMPSLIQCEFEKMVTH